MFFGCQKVNTFSTSGLCHGPEPTRHPAAFCTMRVIHAHIIWVPSALLMSTFFSVVTPEWVSCPKYNQVVITFAYIHGIRPKKLYLNYFSCI